ncbi:MAG: class I SAM-dependent methyltransferase [Terracidiphilus sp.]|jgi:SAM-dependent methyltransferase
MSIEVLARAADNRVARMEMRRQGLDFSTPRIGRWLRRAHLLGGVSVGLPTKSWDVLRTQEFLNERVDKKAPILDLGAHSSEVVLGLHKMGFTDLTGIDLNPAVAQMPGRESIKYVTGNLMQTPFANGAFGAITAISVVEHGFSAAKMFAEVSRLLKLGGYFVGSTDYWPKKIDTSDIVVYGTDWTIFSREEMLAFVEEAAKFQLAPIGPIHLDAVESTTRWLKRSYTFAWFAFQKTA